MAEKKIVVGFDGSPAAGVALTWALDEADRTGAHAALVYADEWPFWAPAASMVPSPALRPDDYVDEVIGGVLDRAVTTARKTHPLVPVSATTVRALASTALARQSEQAAMIVVGSRGHRALAGLLGSVGAAVGAHAHCTVVVVQGRSAAGAPVVAGVDGSPLAPVVLRFAAEQAAGRKVALRVLRLGPPDGEHRAADGDQDAFDAVVTAVRAEFPDLEIHAGAVTADPSNALVAAGDTAQLVVIGSRGRGAVRGLLLGSAGRHLLRYASCPVAIVHEHEEQEEHQEHEAERSGTRVGP
ncbi:universal stress protein [Actinoplanes palleronii]|uniref:Universal stress protein n=1 Tax=Actinoplanes palleronii TaxID=113570 RepID=A0ABQ4BC41_9ACTN|nr:universal stress protein [Actinoplanes palleronii]GIE68228.1 universal stress protein [Actinoplanes palleronii]